MPIRKARIQVLLAGVLALLLTGCGFSSGLPTPTLPATSEPTATTVLLPDLVVTSLEPQFEKDIACFDVSTPLGLRVWVKNIGKAVSGPFMVAVNGFQQNVQSGLAPGETVSLWFPTYNPENEAFADATQQIQESDETNNHLTETLPAPTLPPPCVQVTPALIDILNPAHILQGHQAKVLSLAFSPDGRLLASGSVDDTLRLWQVNQASLLRTMLGHPFPVSSLAFSPSGADLATGSYDGILRVWQVSNGSLLQTLEGHIGRVNGLAYAPNGRVLASGSDDATVRLWRTLDGKLLRTIDEGMSAILSLAYSPNGVDLAWGEADGTVRIWRTSNERWMQIIREPSGAATSVAFSPDGKLLASGSADGNVRIWQVSDGSLLYLLGGHTQAVTSVAFSPDGRMLVSGSADKTLRLWEIGSLPTTQASANSNGTPTPGAANSPIHRQNPAAILVGHTAPITCAAFSPNGKLLASGSEDATILLWNMPEQGAVIPP